MDFRKVNEIVLEEAKKLYDKYSEKGLLSIYSYGSSINKEDFNENSDIDLVAISTDKFNFEYESEMISLLQENNELDIRIRILYLSELNGGQIKSFLAKVLPMKLWLIRFPDYLYLCGQKFSICDFKMKKASFVEAMGIEKDMYLKKRKTFFQDESKAMYLIKSPLHYIYYLSCDQNGYFSFSYNKLLENVSSEFEPILRELIKVKDLHYPKRKVESIISKLDKFMV